MSKILVKDSYMLQVVRHGRQVLLQLLSGPIGPSVPRYWGSFCHGGKYQMSVDFLSVNLVHEFGWIFLGWAALVFCKIEPATAAYLLVQHTCIISQTRILFLPPGRYSSCRELEGHMSCSHRRLNAMTRESWQDFSVFHEYTGRRK